MTKKWMIGLGLALAATLIAIPAFAQDEEEVDRECIEACREAARDCHFDTREAAGACLEDAGCDVLKEEYRDACFGEERDRELCSDARAAYRECVEPCRDARREALEACREAARTCLEDECGVEEAKRPGRRPGRRGPRRR